MTYPAALPLPTSAYGQQCLLDQTQLTRELWALSKNLTPEQGGLGAGTHLAHAANLLFPDTAFKKNRWSDHRAWTVMQNEFTAWWGPGASAKTTDAARIGITYWLAAPHETAVVCCSTTTDGLDRRVWGEIKRLYTVFSKRDDIGDFPARLYAGDAREILYTGDCPSGPSENNCIRGIAIMQGTLEEAIGRVIGSHRPRVLLIVDEAQASREALIEARVNLRKGCRDFRILIIGNPTSRTDPLGRYSEPVQGWEWFYRQIEKRPFTYFSKQRDKEITVQLPYPKVTDWKTKHGHVWLYHGFDSPAMDAPGEAERLHFLIQRANIEQDVDEYGPDHVRLYTFGLGILPPEGSENKPFTEQLFNLANASERVQWRYPPLLVAAVDPSFSTGGDRFMYQLAKVGLATNAHIKIEFQPPVHIQPAPRADESLDDFYCRATAERLRSDGVDIEDFIVDVSGSHSSVLSGIERFYGKRGGTGINSRSNPTALKLAEDEQRPASMVVGNLRTEAWVLLRNFLRFNHLAGVNAEAIRELCAAAFKENPARSKNLLQLVDKKELKAALGKSPDDADTKALICLHARSRYGLMPGNHIPSPELFRKKLVDKPTPTVFRMPVKYGVR